MRTPEPRLLLCDIEVTPNIMTNWGCKVDSGWLPFDGILQERYIICAAWRWLGQSRIHSASILTHPSRDKDMPDLGVLKKLAGVISEADAFIGHNGKKFDLPWIAGRMLIAGMKPLPPVAEIDTKLILKSRFNWNSYALQYAAEKLKVGAKIETKPDLWKRCLRLEGPAIEEMVRYNRHDVDLLEGVYRKIAAWGVPLINRQHWSSDALTCPTCGKPALESRGLGATRVSTYRRLQCRDCGAWARQPMNSKVVR